jgi:hypothetical protein
MRRQVQTAAFNVPEYEPRQIGYYRPRILPHHLRRLWLEKKRTKKSMNKLVDDALDEYFTRRQAS